MDGKGAILIVDDEEIVRESLASWLKADGYQVETAPDGPTALRKMAQGAYSIMLVDLKMPGMDGLQLLAEARKKQPDAAVILMTAYATVDTAVQAMKQGAHDYLMKPIEPEELSEILSHVAKSQALPVDLVLPTTANGTADSAGSLREMERKHVATSLRKHGWNISRTARALGIDRVTLYNKIKRYQIREDE
jgi:DNA-binding NtrC family response regulator